jgi:hypothetical protein
MLFFCVSSINDNEGIYFYESAESINSVLSLDTSIKALYVISNWVFIEKPETGETGFVPIYCLRIPEPSFESPSQNNISLLNVSIYDKSRNSRVSIINNRSSNISTPPPGRVI